MSDLSKIFDGRSRVAKRWGISALALAGIVQTFENVPVWVSDILMLVVQVI